MQIRFIDTLQAVSAEAWNRLCPSDYPFARYEFLLALEVTGCTSAQTGWQPEHLLIEQAGELVAVMPGYRKTHSYGEYVFDWAWADAYGRHGLDYYPKWINAIPFTPCQGPRLLAGQYRQLTELLALASQALAQRCRERGYSSWHCLFPQASVSEQLQTLPLLQRLGCQFHWHNPGYASFDDFVARMSSRKRKNIVKERRLVAQQGFVFDCQSGTQLSADDWQLFYSLYRTTYLKRSGHNGYLSADFFQQLGATMGDQLVLIRARHGAAPEQVVAASLFMRDSATLYGRYWGCFEEYQYLHFETCYYQGIDYAINQGLTRFDGGAQGEHKIARGFEPQITYSHHWIAQPEFGRAIAQFVQSEAEQVQAYARSAAQLLPFKAD